MKGFKVAAFNENIFGDDDFLPASVTEQPPPLLPAPPSLSQTMEAVATTSSEPHGHQEASEPFTSTSNFVSASSQSSFRNLPTFSLEFVRSLPKAGQRKTTEGRKRRKTWVLTDTQEKYTLEIEQNSRRAKKQKETMKAKVKNATRKVMEESDDESGDQYFCLVCTVD